MIKSWSCKQSKALQLHLLLNVLHMFLFVFLCVSGKTDQSQSHVFFCFLELCYDNTNFAK